MFLSVASCGNLLGIDELVFSSPDVENQRPVEGEAGFSTDDQASGSGAASPLAGNAAGGVQNGGGAVQNAGEAGLGPTSQAGQGAELGCALDAVRSLSCLSSIECAERPCGGYLWDGSVPFELDDQLSASVRNLVENAAAIWSVADTVEFSRCESDDCAAEGRARWLRVEAGQHVLSPSSNSGPQSLALPPTVSNERVVHELGHVLGLPDLWRRPDRDRYLTLSEQAFCGAGASWDPSTCTLGTPDGLAQPQRRSTGLLGAFDSNSAMNLAGPEICETQEPEARRAVPTDRDRAALIELYRTAAGWSPFAPLGREVAADLPLEHTLAPEVTMLGVPALASRHKPLLEVYLRGSDAQIYWKHQARTSGGDWSDWQPLGCCFDSDPTAFSASVFQTDLFARSVDGDILWNTLSDPSGAVDPSWGAWQSIGAPEVGAASAPAVAGTYGQFGKRLDVFLRGNDDALYRKTYAGSWEPSWAKVDASLFVGTPAAAARSDEKIDVVVATATGRLLQHTFDGAQSRSSQSLDAPIAPDTSPALAASAGGLYLYVRTPLQHLAERVLSAETWGAWRNLGGMLESSPAVVGHEGRPHVDVAAILDDAGQDSLWLRSWPYLRPCYVGASACGTCAEPCDGACPTYSDPAGDPTFYTRLDGRDVVLSRADDGHVYELARVGASWSFRDLSMAAGASPLAASNLSAQVRKDGSDYVNSIAYRSISSEAVELFSLNSLEAVEWKSRTFSQSAQAPHAQGDVALFNPFEQASVLYRGRDARIYEITESAGLWVFRDLSTDASAPDASGDPQPFSSSILYRSENNRLSEIYLESPVSVLDKGVPMTPAVRATWVTKDMLLEANAPDAAGDPAAYVRSDARNAVLYRGLDGHIYELSAASGGNDWSVVDLTSATGVPTAASDPRGYRRSDDTDAVVYQGVDQHIHELSRHGEQWLWTNLSSEARSAAAASRPMPYRRNDHVNGVVYRAADARLYELSLVNGVWKKTVIYDPSSLRQSTAEARESSR